MRRSKNREKEKVKAKPKKIENFSLVKKNQKNESTQMLSEMK